VYFNTSIGAYSPPNQANEAMPFAYGLVPGNLSLVGRALLT
jgi:hypothetical protein